MDIDLVFQNLTGSHIVLGAGLCGPDLLWIINKMLIITENKKISCENETSRSVRSHN